MDPKSIPPMAIIAIAVAVVIAAAIASRGSGAQVAVSPGPDSKLYEAQVTAYNAQVEAANQYRSQMINAFLTYDNNRQNYKLNARQVELDGEDRARDDARDSAKQEADNNAQTWGIIGGIIQFVAGIFL